MSGVYKKRANKMAHGIYEPAAQPEHLNVAPGTDTVKGENRFLQVVLSLSHACMHVPLAKIINAHFLTRDI